jgi:hypothetical protein
MDETAVAGKPVQVGFDGGRLTYDADGAPITIRVHPILFWDVNASQDRRCQHRDHQRCDTRKQSAGMGSGSRTASRHSASKTIGVPQPATTAANPVHSSSARRR